MTARTPQPSATSTAFIGPPASGKSAALARAIDSLLRQSVNPYTLFVCAPYSTGVDALFDRVLKLSGKTRASQYRFLTFKALLSEQAKQSPQLRVVADRDILDLSLASFAALGAEPEFYSPVHCTDQGVASGSFPAAPILLPALERLGVLHPYDVLGRSDRSPLTADYMFVDDLHLLPVSVLEWLRKQESSGTALIVTYDPHFPRSEPLHVSWPTRVEEMVGTKKRNQASTFTRPSHPLKRYPTAASEVEAIVTAVSSSSPPEVLIFANPAVESRTLIRCALRGHPPISSTSHSVYASRELRYLCTALEVVLHNRPASLEQLLHLFGINPSMLARELRAARCHASLLNVVHDPTAIVLSDDLAASLESFSAHFGRWLAPLFPHELVDAVADALTSTGAFPQPYLFSIFASETADSELPLTEVYERLVACLHGSRASRISGSGQAPEVLSPAQTLGRCYSNVWVNTTHRGPIDLADSFVYLSSSHTRRAVTLSYSPGETIHPCIHNLQVDP